MPEWVDNALLGTTTKILVTIDLGFIQNQLEQYDIMLQTKLFTSSRDEMGIEQEYCWEYVRVCRNVQSSRIEFEATILGAIRSTDKINGQTEGFYIYKQRRDA